MQRMPRAGVIATLAAAAVLLAAAPARAQTYRLGTASRPFGWSTAIGDLDADGRPDVAIADRVGRLDAGFQYALELSIAGGGSRSVIFNAPDAALAVSLLDFDHDQDLDVVVSAPMSRAVVRVWLNDGHGQFSEAVPGTAASYARLGGDQADSGDPDAPGAVAAVPSPRRDLSARPHHALQVAGADASHQLAARPQHLTVRFDSSRSAPRAPPLVVLDV